MASSVVSVNSGVILLLLCVFLCALWVSEVILFLILPISEKRVLLRRAGEIRVELIEPALLVRGERLSIRKVIPNGAGVGAHRAVIRALL